MLLTDITDTVSEEILADRAAERDFQMETPCSAHISVVIL